MTTLAPAVGLGFAFSPDSRWVALFDNPIIIASLDGTAASMTVPHDGEPRGWLR